MTASPHIKTPTMTVPLAVEESAHQKGLKLKKLFTRVLLSDVSQYSVCALWSALLTLLCYTYIVKHAGYENLAG